MKNLMTIIIGITLFFLVSNIFAENKEINKSTTTLKTKIENSSKSKINQNFEKQLAVAKYFVEDRKYEKAMLIIRPFAEKGYAKAQFELGNVMYSVRGIFTSPKEFLSWYIKAAEQGYLQAQIRLGRTYHYGRGVDIDYKESLRWMKKAAEQGDEMAQFKVAVKYHQGEFADCDYKEAIKWYTRAANQDNVAAQRNLSDMYYFGSGVEKDYIKAHKWVNISEAQNSNYAEFRIRIEAKMTKEQIVKARQLALDFVPKKEKQSVN